MANPLPTPPHEWSSDQFRDPALKAPAGRERGLVGHVPIVGALMLVQGGLELVVAFFGILFVALVFLVPDRELMQLRGAGVIVAIMFGPTLVVAIVRILAGLHNVRYRRRMLGMAALGLGLLTIFTAYCAPTAIALAVYGLIVYLNEPVVAAFEMGNQGRRYSEIQAAFPAR